jgi:hypothetical protein
MHKEVLVRKPEIKRPHGRPMFGKNMKMVVKETYMMLWNILN